MVEAIASQNPEDHGMDQKKNEKTISRRSMVSRGFTASAGLIGALGRREIRDRPPSFPQKILGYFQNTNSVR